MNLQTLNQQQQIRLGLTIFLLCLLAWLNRFIQDDAFISFRYAQFWVQGQGLVWNSGEYIEGYTNFLWTLFMTIPLLFKLDPIIFSYILGIICFGLSLFFTFKSALRLGFNFTYALTIIILLGTNYSFSAYATGGLETQLQACLLIALFYQGTKINLKQETEEISLIQTALLFSIIAALAILTRLDSAIIVGVLMLVVLIHATKTLNSKKIAFFSALIMPFALIIGSWLIWKLNYYGDILPNTYYAKVNSVPSYLLLQQGIVFIYSFFYSYWLFPFLLLLIFSLSKKRLLQSQHAPFIVLTICFFLWLVYLLKVGGDFMEFRFFVPILPFFFLLVAWLILQISKQVAIQFAFALLIILGSIHHYIFFMGVVGINPIQALNNFIQVEHNDDVGKILKVLFKDTVGGKTKNAPPVSLATIAAGAVPYYAELPTLDMFGLTDAWVAKHGMQFANKPGHYRLAPFDFLLQKRINLILGLPQIKPRQESFMNLYPNGLEQFFVSSYILNYPNAQRNTLFPHPECQNSALSLNHSFFNQPWLTYFCPVSQLPPTAKIIEIPINHQSKLIALYLTPHPIIDAAIQELNLIVYSIGQ